MNKREFVNHVASLVGGKVVDVEKANGVIYTGIQLSTNDNGNGNKIAPVIYLDEQYENGWSIDDAVAYVFKADSENRITVNLDFTNDFEVAKPMLRVGMLNKKSNVPCYISAEKFGFDDLIIYPYVKLSTSKIGQTSTKVTSRLLADWGVDLDTVIRIALENMEKETEVAPYIEKLIELGMPEDMAIQTPMAGWFIVSNKSMNIGAANILTRTAKYDLPEEYIVIPSSIHEVIVAPYTEETAEQVTALAEIINQVNETDVKPEEVLGYKPYVIRS